MEPLLKDLREIGTPSLQRILSAIPNSVLLYGIYTFSNSEEDNLPTRDKTASPKVSFSRRFHCMYYLSSHTLVSIGPGAITLNLIPYRPHSLANDLIIITVIIMIVHIDTIMMI